MTGAIRVRYVTHPGSNVGDYRATVHGMRATVRADQSLSREDNHRAAAVKLAGKLPAPVALPGWLTPGDILTALTAVATDEGYTFAVLDPWPADDVAGKRSQARYVLGHHGHAGYWDALTRANCGACALAGYGAAPGEGPNYGAWARVYVQAGRSVPEDWRAAFVRELAGSDPRNTTYADALRRDILTYGVTS